MPTFKAVVQKHQKRTTDGKYPVSIRVTHNRKSIYIKTGLYCASKQINPRTFDIRDQFIIERTNRTIEEMERKLLSVSTDELLQMDVNAIRLIVGHFSKQLDMLAYAKEICAQNARKHQNLASAIRVIEVDMGYKSFPVNLFTSKFLDEYKKVLDEKSNMHDKKNQLLNSTKNMYLCQLHKLFTMMKEQYNTDYCTVISHDPFIKLKYYKENKTKKRTAIDIDTLRKLFAYRSSKPNKQIVVDFAKISFCLCGMNAKDIFSCKRSCYANGRITYNRSKTKNVRDDEALTSVKVEPEIQDLVDKYLDTEYLFKTISIHGKRDTDRLNTTLNHNLKLICKELGIPKFTFYDFRHTHATIARNDCGLSKDDVDVCLNHKGENNMADVYIHNSWKRIDAANRKVLDYVFLNNLL